MNRSIFEKIGGETTIRVVVDIFYDKVLEDPLLARFFEKLDRRAHSRKLINYMSWAFGGPKDYRGLDLSTAHRDLVMRYGLSDEHFDCLILYLKQSFEEVDVPQPTLDQIMPLIEGMRNQVLGKA